MNRENRNQLRKKIQNYSYGLNDHLDLDLKGNIFKGINDQNAEKVAVKVVDLRNRQPQFVKEHLSIEIEVLKKLKHPNIIQCLDIFSTVNNCYIITEFCDQGDLSNRLSSRGSFKESEAIILFRDIFNGFLYLATEKYIHGNLKPSCLLIKENVVKISGFSNSRKASKQVRWEIKFDPFQSPQSVKQNIFNTKSDIWSLGMILYVLVHGCLPWEFKTKAEYLQRVGKPFNIKPELSEELKEFIRKTVISKQNRLDLEDLSNNPFIQKIQNNYFTTEKFVVGIIQANEIKNKKDDKHLMNKVEKQINAQVNWMRFLFRLIERIMTYPEQLNTLVLKFIMIRQLAVQFQELKRSFTGDNPFGFNNWKEFLKEEERVKKYIEILTKNQARYDKIKTNYKRFVEKITLNGSFTYLASILNQNFILSEFNCMVAIKASLEEIKRLWARVTKEYPAKVKYEKDMPFRFKAELLLLDFMISYYQLNCLLIDDFHRIDYFQKMSKLQMILEYPPTELDASSLQQFELKLTQLTIIP